MLLAAVVFDIAIHPSIPSIPSVRTLILYIFWNLWPTAFRFQFPKCILPKCIFPKCMFPKFIFFKVLFCKACASSKLCEFIIFYIPNAILYIHTWTFCFFFGLQNLLQYLRSQPIPLLVRLWGRERSKLIKVSRRLAALIGKMPWAAIKMIKRPAWQTQACLYETRNPLFSPNIHRFAQIYPLFDIWPDINFFTIFSPEAHFGRRGLQTPP